MRVPEIGCGVDDRLDAIVSFDELEPDRETFGKTWPGAVADQLNVDDRGEVTGLELDGVDEESGLGFWIVFGDVEVVSAANDTGFFHRLPVSSEGGVAKIDALSRFGESEGMTVVDECLPIDNAAMHRDVDPMVEALGNLRARDRFFDGPRTIGSSASDLALGRRGIVDRGLGWGRGRLLSARHHETNHEQQERVAIRAELLGEVHETKLSNQPITQIQQGGGTREILDPKAEPAAVNRMSVEAGAVSAGGRAENESPEEPLSHQTEEPRIVGSS